jgi:hypothetical protein
MKITIETLAGDKSEFDVEEEDTVVCLKLQVQAKQLQQGNAVRVDQITLVCNGQQLNDSETFTSQHIVAGSVMHMILERDEPGGAMPLLLCCDLFVCPWSTPPVVWRGWSMFMVSVFISCVPLWVHAFCGWTCSCEVFGHDDFIISAWYLVS